MKFASLIHRPFSVARENVSAYLVLNLCTYGMFVAGLIVGTVWPSVSGGANDLVGILSTASPASSGVAAAMSAGTVWLLVIIIFVANVLIGGVLMAFLPSVVIPFAGIAVHVGFASLLGLTFAPDEGWSTLLLHLPTLMIEMQAYVFFMLGVYILGRKSLRPRLRGFRTRWAGYRHGLAEVGWLCIPAGLLLAVGAVYEAFDVTTFLR